MTNKRFEKHMRLVAKLAAIGLFLPLIALAATKIHSAAITNSTIDSSPIGSSVPSSGIFSTLATGSGTTINQIYFGTLTLTYPAINFGACMDETGSFTGVLASAFIGINETAGTASSLASYSIAEKAASHSNGSVTVTVCNNTTNAMLNWPGGAVTFNLLVVE